MLNPLESVLRDRSRFFHSRNLSGWHIGLLVVTEVSFSEPDLTAIPPLAMGSPVSGPGPNHAIELGIRYGFHVLESTEADLCLDFAAALERLRTPSSQSGWVSLP